MIKDHPDESVFVTIDIKGRENVLDKEKLAIARLTNRSSLAKKYICMQKKYILKDILQVSIFRQDNGIIYLSFELHLFCRVQAILTNGKRQIADGQASNV